MPRNAVRSVVDIDIDRLGVAAVDRGRSHLAGIGPGIGIVTAAINLIGVDARAARTTRTTGSPTFGGRLVEFGLGGKTCRGKILEHRSRFGRRYRFGRRNGFALNRGLVALGMTTLLGGR